MHTAEELLALTPAQRKAWKKLQAAVKEFRSAGGAFHSCLDVLHGYNSEYVDRIVPGTNGDCQAEASCMSCIRDDGFSSHADDDAGLFFNDEGTRLLNA